MLEQFLFFLICSVVLSINFVHDKMNNSPQRKIGLDNQGNFSMVGNEHELVILEKVDYGWKKVANLESHSNEEVFGSMGINSAYACIVARNSTNNNETIVVLQKTEEGWEQHQILSPKMKTNNMDRNSGYAISLSDTYLVIGTPYHMNHGAAFFYRLNSTGYWIEEEEIFPEDGTNDDEYGSSVDIFENGEETLCVVGSQNKGKIYIYKRTNNHWTLEKEFLSQHTNQYGYGKTVAISSNFVMVGEPFASHGYHAEEEGIVHIYQRKENNEWESIDFLMDSEEDEHFGFDLAMNEDFAIIGTKKNAMDNHVPVYIYKFDQFASKWKLFEKITKFDEEEENFLERTVAISKSKNIFLVGVNRYNSSIKGNIHVLETKCNFACWNGGYPNDECSTCICVNHYSPTTECSTCGLSCSNNGTVNSDCSFCEDCVMNIVGESGDWEFGETCDIICKNGKIFLDSHCQDSSVLSFAIFFVSLLAGFIVLCFIFAPILLLLMNIKKEKKKTMKMDIETVDCIFKEQELKNLELENQPSQIKINRELFKVKFSDLEIIEQLPSEKSSMILKTRYQGEYMVFKSFNIRKFKKEGNCKQVLKEFEKRISLFAGLKHPSIVSYFGACFSPLRIGICLEYCGNSNIKDFLGKEENKNMKFALKLEFILQICKAMNYLHEKEIIYRDLQSSNVLISSSLEVRLSDFSFIPKKSIRRTGKSQYIAPEAKKKNGTYDKNTDIYASSILFWEILTQNFQPYMNLTPEQIKQPTSYLRPDLNLPIFNSAENEWIKDILEDCWDQIPTKRRSFKEIITQIENRLENQS